METILLCQQMVEDLADHDLLVLARQFVRDNQERAQVLVSVPVLFLVVDPSQRAMVVRVEVELVEVTTPVVRSEVELVLVAHAPVAQVVPEDQVVQARAVAVPAKHAVLSVAVAKVARPIDNKNHGRLVAKRSIIYAHQLLVERSFRAVMALR